MYAKTKLLLFFSLVLCTAGSTQPPMNPGPPPPIFETIRSGDVTVLQEKLTAGADANSIYAGYSALMAATLHGSVDQMKLLLGKGANVNYANPDGISALWLAVPDQDKTALLLTHGANVNQKSREGNTVLIKLAAIPGSAALIEQIIGKGCDPKKSSAHNDLLYNAAQSGDTAMVGLLIRQGLSVNDTTFFGDYPINGATNFRSFNVIKMLVEHGAKVNVSPKTGILPLFIGVTPLMWAAVSNDKASFYYLLEHGADPKLKSPGQYTSLMYLAMSEEDDPEMTMALIKLGVNPADRALDETDALSHAKMRGNTKSVAILSNYVSNNTKTSTK